MQPSDRAAYFRPKWFVDLLMGRLSFGDTFWAGLFGSMLLFVPVGFVLTMGASLISPGNIDGMLIAIMGFYAVYLTLLVRVVLITGWHCTTTSGWRWVGMVYILLQTAAQYALVYRLIIGSEGV